MSDATEVGPIWHLVPGSRVQVVAHPSVHASWVGCNGTVVETVESSFGHRYVTVVVDGSDAGPIEFRAAAIAHLLH